MNYNKTRGDELKCPNCNNGMFFNLDSYGFTPIHLHCDNCDINIGANSFDKCLELLKEHHKPNTWLEYHGGKIRLLHENNKCIIDEREGIYEL